MGVDPDLASAQVLEQWTTDCWEATHRYSAGAGYANFMMDEGQERARAAYGQNYDRLAQLKAAYDRANVFRVNQKIWPAASSDRRYRDRAQTDVANGQRAGDARSCGLHFVSTRPPPLLLRPRFALGAVRQSQPNGCGLPYGRPTRGRTNQKNSKGKTSLATGEPCCLWSPRDLTEKGEIMFKRLGYSALLAGALVAGSPLAVTSAGASGMPSGEVMYGNTTYDATTGHFVGGGGTIEPAYDDTTGTLVYLQTPNKAPVNPPKPVDPTTNMAVNVAPIYITVYPAGSGVDPANLNCAHMPADNCPDHGPLVAGAAMSIQPSVYGGGVLGHDHLVGIASTGGDFNVLWEPVLVLFTNTGAATEHITTLAQLDSDLGAANVVEIPLPALDFYCSSVSAAAYARGVAAPTVVGP